VAEWTFVCAAVIAQGCVVHEERCTRNAECDDYRAGFCSKSGFCTKECVRSIDCPCGSICATGCGICLRVDFSGPATCFPYREGLSTEEVLGTCRRDIATMQSSGRSDDSSSDALAEADVLDAGDEGVTNGTCDLKRVSLPICAQSPPTDASTANGDVSVQDVEASASDTVGETDESTDLAEANPPGTTAEAGREGAAIDAPLDEASADISVAETGADTESEP
jgi:hypothetical protein